MNVDTLNLFYKNKKTKKIIYYCNNILKKNKKINDDDLIYIFNILACAYINDNNLENALKTYKLAKLLVKNFDGPKIKYNIGIVPYNVEKTDILIKKYLEEKLCLKKFKNKDFIFKELYESLRINPKTKGEYHSNIGATLINIIKIEKDLKKRINTDSIKNISYSNPKYNAFRAERLLKNRKFQEFQKELRRISKFHKYNFRAYCLSTYAYKKYNLKDLTNFCSEPIDCISVFNLTKNGYLTHNFIKNVVKEIKILSSRDSYSPGSIFSGFKSVGNLFNAESILFKKLKIIIQKNIKDYLKKNKRYRKFNYIKKFPKNYLLKGWYIRIKQGGGITHHIHNAWLSGVLYLKVPKKRSGGNIEFSIAGCGFKNEKKMLKEISPQASDLILFPSSLPHRVKKFNNNNERISLAFDVVPI